MADTPLPLLLGSNHPQEQNPIPVKAFNILTARIFIMWWNTMLASNFSELVQVVTLYNTCCSIYPIWTRSAFAHYLHNSNVLFAGGIFVCNHMVYWVYLYWMRISFTLCTVVCLLVAQSELHSLFASDFFATLHKCAVASSATYVIGYDEINCNKDLRLFWS